MIIKQRKSDEVRPYSTNSFQILKNWKEVQNNDKKIYDSIIEIFENDIKEA